MTEPDTEAEMWADLNGALDHVWDATRHEDGRTLGVPDVSYGLMGVDGWLELKVSDHALDGQGWPDARRPFVLPKLTAAQRAFLRRRAARGSGHAYVLARVRRRWWLLLHAAVLPRLGEPLADIRAAIEGGVVLLASPCHPDHLRAALTMPRLVHVEHRRRPI